MHARVCVLVYVCASMCVRVRVYSSACMHTDVSCICTDACICERSHHAPWQFKT